jgi:hypothetical protein
MMDFSASEATMPTAGIRTADSLQSSKPDRT